MKLFIDAGNTRAKYAWHDGVQWQHHIALPLERSLNNNDYPPSLAQITEIAGVSVVSNTAQQRIEHNIQSLFSNTGPVKWIRSSSNAGGIRNLYDSQQLGVDRWAAAVAAWHKLQSACLVVMVGTATTIDILSTQGEFSGGYILPGIEMMLDSLAQGTQQLPQLTHTENAIDLSVPPQATHHSILAGCLYAQLGAIERVRNSIGANTAIVIGGGARKFLVTQLPAPLYEDDMLVLDGIRILDAESKSF